MPIKFLIYTISALCLNFSVAVADDEYLDAAVDLEDLASRMNTIKADDYIEITTPVQNFARTTAKNLTDKEVNALVDGQNAINRIIARRNSETPQKAINIDASNREEVEKLLTPEIYTYDDITAE